MDLLPYEILEEAFRYLPSKDAKSLLEVNHRIREIVMTSGAVMRMLPVFLGEHWHNHMDFLKAYGDAVRDLRFDHCMFNSPEEFKEAIKLLQGIECLKLTNVHIKAENYKKEFEVIVIKFPRLKKIEMDNSKANGKILSFLKKTQVKQLKLDFCHFNVTTEFTDFFSQQEDLHTLFLSGWENVLMESLFGVTIIFKICFQLKKLVLDHNIIKNEHFFNFLRFQTEIEELEILKEVQTEDFVNLVFTEFKKLKRLTLRTNFVSLKNINFKKAALSPLSELVLITRSEYGIEHTINQLVIKLLNLKSLKIVNMKPDNSQVLESLHLKKLENLFIENSKLRFLQNIKFNCLKTIHINSLQLFLKADDWTNLLKNNPNIESLIVRDIECNYQTDVIKAEINKIIYNLHYVVKTLKYLEISQELTYQKPIKLVVKVAEKYRTLKCSDSFIKLCRTEFHYLRNLGNYTCSYFDDDCLI